MSYTLVWISSRLYFFISYSSIAIYDIFNYNIKVSKIGGIYVYRRFIKEYREANGVSIEDFATKAGLTVTEIEALENNLQEDGTVIPVAMRQIKGIAAAMSVPMPVVMAQIPSDQELVVHVVAESDQPHAK